MRETQRHRNELSSPADPQQRPVLEPGQQGRDEWTSTFQSPRVRRGGLACVAGVARLLPKVVAPLVSAEIRPGRLQLCC